MAWCASHSTCLCHTAGARPLSRGPRHTSQSHPRPVKLSARCRSILCFSLSPRPISRSRSHRRQNARDPRRAPPRLRSTHAAPVKSLAPQKHASALHRITPQVVLIEIGLRHPPPSTSVNGTLSVSRLFGLLSLSAPPSFDTPPLPPLYFLPFFLSFPAAAASWRFCCSIISGSTAKLPAARAIIQCGDTWFHAAA